MLTRDWFFPLKATLSAYLTTKSASAIQIPLPRFSLHLHTRWFCSSCQIQTLLFPLLRPSSSSNMFLSTPCPTIGFNHQQVPQTQPQFKSQKPIVGACTVSNLLHSEEHIDSTFSLFMDYTDAYAALKKSMDLSHYISYTIFDVIAQAVFSKAFWVSGARPRHA